MPAYLLLRVNLDKEMKEKSKQLVLQLIFESEQDLMGVSQLCAVSVGFQFKTLEIAS